MLDWRKGPGEWKTVGLSRGTDEIAENGDLGEVKTVFLCDWVRRRFWYAVASDCLMHLSSSLLSARSLCSYSLTTSQPSSEESAIKISLFLWASFFSPSLSSSRTFSTCGGVDWKNEEADWTWSRTWVFASNCFSLLFFSNFGADEGVDLSLFIADSCSSDNSLLRDAK